MRLAVREDLNQALDDPEVDAALSKFGVKTKNELVRDANALKKKDPGLKKAVPRVPIIRSYAALIINEKESAIIQLDEKALKHGDAPSLFILPRAPCEKAGISEKKVKPLQTFNNTFKQPIWNIKIDTLRCGTNWNKNFSAQYMIRHDEGGIPNGEDAYGGKVGVQAWQRFKSQLQSAEVGHSPAAITAARNKLDAFSAEKKTNK